MMRGYLLGAGLNGAMGVAIGAWASHGLRASLPEAAIEWVRTGASYQLWHAAALLGLGATATLRRTRLFPVAGLALGIGALVFSGALYLHALAGLGWIASLAPVGGLLMIVGWLAVLAAAFRLRAAG
jgi:uncharacterized membrane protein YgdD (TMEM256/DUF423 family)